MKQLILVINEDSVSKLLGFFNSLGIELLEIQGMDIDGKDYQILVTPTPTKHSVEELEIGTTGEINGIGE
jgi:hypothetical protein